MRKIAQERSIFNKLEENLDIVGISAEKFFSPELSQVMKKLRIADDTIRAVVTGKEIGDAKPISPGPGLKDILKQSKSNLNRREYLKVIYLLSDFHKKVTEINTIITELDLTLAKFHYKFFVDKEKKGDIISKKEELEKALKAKAFERRSKFLIKRANDSHYYAVTKHAGVLDSLHNFFTQRGRALSFWESRNPEKLTIIKEQSEKMIEEAESFLDGIINSLKEMGKARAGRKVDEYRAAVKNISNMYQSFHGIFKIYHDNVAKPILDYLEKVMPSDESSQSPDSSRPLVLDEESDTGAISSDTGATSSDTGATSPNTGTSSTALQNTSAVPYIGIYETTIKGIVDDINYIINNSQDSNVGIGHIKKIVDNPSNFYQQLLNTFDLANKGDDIAINIANYFITNYYSFILRSQNLFNFIKQDFRIYGVELFNQILASNSFEEICLGISHLYDKNNTDLHMFYTFVRADKNVTEAADVANKINNFLASDYSDVVTQLSSSNTATAYNLSFMKMLEKLSGESPIILSHIITKHAQIIKHKDPVTALKLLKIASKIK